MSVPRVTAVIPTFGRADLVFRATQSALAQTIEDIEVIVVIDGPDEATAQRLSAIADSRLRIVSLASKVGGGEARNLGVQAASSRWVAFLDDDDEWLPEKLALQLEKATQSRFARPVVTSRFRATNRAGNEYLWPRRAKRPDEPISEYILARSSLVQGEGLISTSMIFAPTQLLLETPFRKELPRHQEWDWLLRVAAQEGVGFESVFEELGIWNINDQRARVSNQNDWKDSFYWIQSMRALVTRRAYASFLMVVVSAIASNQGNRSVFPLLLGEAWRNGSPRPIDFLLMAGMWFLPQSGRRRVRNMLALVGRRA